MTARVLVTGAAGFIGSQVLGRLRDHPDVEHVVGVDIVDRHDAGLHILDIRDGGLAEVLADERIDRLVHLAAIVTPQPHHTRGFLHSVEVEGTRNVVEACLAAGVGHLTVTSSGAAYGYWPDNPEWIDEDDALRGNASFAYADHKRQVEEMLAGYRESHPELRQLILRPGTILGETVDNQITAIFERPVVTGIAGSPTPFVFMWDTDVLEVIVQGVTRGIEGRFNLAGDGAVPLAEIAEELGKRHVAIPAWLVKGVLSVLHPLRIAPYGPEQVDFLRYRPVLANRRLKEDFGFTPSKTSLEVLRAWRDR